MRGATKRSEVKQNVTTGDILDLSRAATIDIVPAFQRSLGKAAGILQTTDASSTSDASGLVQISTIVDKLSRRLEGAAVMAKRVSAQVEKLDAQKERIALTLEAVTGVMHLRNCSSRVATALDKGISKMVLCRSSYSESMGTDGVQY